MGDKKQLFQLMIFCMVIFLQGSWLTVHAQAPDEAGEEPPPAVASSGRLDLTFRQLGYSADQLDPDRFESSYRINLPGNFQISPTGNYLDLVLSYLLQTPDQPASLIVDLNDRPVSAITLTSVSAVSETVRLDLPEGLLQPGRNSIDLFLKTGRSCDEPGAAVEVLVEGNSTLSFGYEQNPYPADLARYPFPFTEGSLLEIPVIMVLPDSPTSNDLSIATTVAAGLGRMSGGNISLTTVLAGNIEPDSLSNSHLIVIGRPDNNSVLSNLELPLPIEGANIVKPGQGILEEIVSPWNEFRLVLVVSGLDDEGVAKAGHTLNRQAHFLGMRGPFAVVLEILPFPEPENSGAASMTLASLGYGDELAYGAAPRKFAFDFELPPGWRLENSPFFVLKFSHAEILDPYQSIIDIKLNRLPVGSALLNESNTNMGELTVTLPANRLRTGRNRLEVGVEMSIPDGDRCKNANDERAWTVISSESEIFLPYNAINLPPDLELLPYPFSHQFGFDQTMLVLPDQTASAFFNDMIQIAVQLGIASRLEYISPRVAFASEVNDASQQNYNLILLGRTTENPVLGEVNPYLPQPFISGNDLLQPLVVDNVAFAPDPNRNAGLLQIIRSPWNGDYSILAVTGTTDEGYRLAIQTLLDGGNNLKGNLVVVEPALELGSDQPANDIYSTDTRPAVSIDEQSSTNSKNSESELSQLARRWWR